MDDPDPKPQGNAFEQMFDRPVTQRREGEDGIGPTLGQDLSVQHERDEDAHHGARPIDDEEEEG